MPSIGLEKIKKDCPKCGCSKEKIEYWNCGPIVYIMCPECRYHITEGKEALMGKLFETWNEEK